MTPHKLILKGILVQLVDLHMPLLVLLELGKELFPLQALLGGDSFKHLLDACSESQDERWIQAPHETNRMREVLGSRYK